MNKRDMGVKCRLGENQGLNYSLVLHYSLGNNYLLLFLKSLHKPLKPSIPIAKLPTKRTAKSPFLSTSWSIIYSIDYQQCHFPYSPSQTLQHPETILAHQVASFTRLNKIVSTNKGTTGEKSHNEPLHSNPWLWQAPPNPPNSGNGAIPGGQGHAARHHEILLYAPFVIRNAADNHSAYFPNLYRAVSARAGLMQEKAHEEYASSVAQT